MVPDGCEVSGHGTDGSWFITGLHPDNGLYPVAQGGPQHLGDTVETGYHTWRQLGDPAVEQFGVTAPDDTALQSVTVIRVADVSPLGCHPL
ncbi:MAG: hypothetical protein ACRDRX_24735 [Pseudonocardiaceae bacterium]